MQYKEVHVNSKYISDIYNVALRSLELFQEQAQRKHDKDATDWHNFTLSQFKRFTEIRDMFYAADIIEYTHFIDRPIQVEAPVNKIEVMLDECKAMLIACEISPDIVLTQEQAERVYYFKKEKYVGEAQEYLDSKLEFTEQYTDETIEDCKRLIALKEKYSLDSPEKPKVKRPIKTIAYACVSALFLAIALVCILM